MNKRNFTRIAGASLLSVATLATVAVAQTPRGEVESRDLRGDTSGIWEAFDQTEFERAMVSAAAGLTAGMYVDAQSEVGIGTSNPASLLHILDSAGPSTITIQNLGGAGGAADTGIYLRNNGAAFFYADSTQAGANDFQVSFQPNSVVFFAAPPGAAGPFTSIMRVSSLGNVTIPGDFITDANTYPDYVFEEDYELMGLGDLEAFIAENKHLPNVPSQADVDADGGQVRINELQIKMLEKIEELTLYTIQQNKSIESLATANVELLARLEALEANG